MLKCSFCGKFVDKDYVQCGTTPSVCICAKCVAAANAIVHDEKVGHLKVVSMAAYKSYKTWEKNLK